MISKIAVEKFNEKDSNLDNFDINNIFSGYDSFIKDSIYVPSKSGLDLYLKEEVFPRSASFNILGWWKTNGIKYPILQKKRLPRIYWPSKYQCLFGICF